MSEEQYGRNNVTNPFAQTAIHQQSAYSRPNYDGDNSAVNYDQSPITTGPYGQEQPSQY